VQFEYKKRHLDNGLCVIGVENRALHLFAASVRVHAGPRFEPQGQTGLTHFLEHMILQGSRGFPTSRDVLRAVEAVGGVIDACTHPEALELYVGVHRKHWRRGLEVLIDSLLNPLFDEKEVEQEKHIVTQELAETRDERGRSICAGELVYSLMFKEEVDELGARGSKEIIDGFTRGLVVGQYEQFLHPRNMVVSLAGGLDFDEVLEKLAATLGAMPADKPLPHLRRCEVARRRARAIYRATERTPVVDMELSYSGFGLGDERFGAMVAAAHILGGGLSSRLFTRVREELGLVYDVTSVAMTYSDTGSLNVMLSSDAASLVQAAEAVRGVIREFRDAGVSDDEMERYKENVRCGMDIMCDRPQHLAEWLGNQELLLRPEHLMTPHEFAAKQEGLTKERMAEVLAELLKDSESNLAVVGPLGKREANELRKLFPAEEVEISDR